MQQEDWFSQINIIRAFDVQTAFCISIMLCILMLCWCEILITHKTRNDIVSLWKWKMHQKEYIDGEIHNYRNCAQCNLALHTHVHFTALFQRVSRYQKGTSNLDFTEARDSRPCQACVLMASLPILQKKLRQKPSLQFFSVILTKNSQEYQHWNRNHTSFRMSEFSIV